MVQSLQRESRQNSVNDLHSLLRFLNVNPYNNIHWFKANIEGPMQRQDWEAAQAMKRLQLSLSRVLLRRRKEESTDGVRNLDIAPIDLHCDPSKHMLDATENSIYAALQDRFSSILHQSTRPGKNGELSVGLSTRSIFVLILRLRQGESQGLVHSGKAS